MAPSVEANCRRHIDPPCPSLCPAHGRVNNIRSADPSGIRVFHESGFRLTESRRAVAAGPQALKGPGAGARVRWPARTLTWTCTSTRTSHRDLRGAVFSPERARVRVKSRAD